MSKTLWGAGQEVGAGSWGPSAPKCLGRWRAGWTAVQAGPGPPGPWVALGPLFTFRLAPWKALELGPGSAWGQGGSHRACEGILVWQLARLPKGSTREVGGEASFTLSGPGVSRSRVRHWYACPRALGASGGLLDTLAYAPPPPTSREKPGPSARSPEGSAHGATAGPVLPRRGRGRGRGRVISQPGRPTLAASGERKERSRRNLWAMVSPQEREVEGLSLPKVRSGGP